MNHKSVIAMVFKRKHHFYIQKLGMQVGVGKGHLDIIRSPRYFSSQEDKKGEMLNQMF